MIRKVEVSLFSSAERTNLKSVNGKLREFVVSYNVNDCQ